MSCVAERRVEFSRGFQPTRFSACSLIFRGEYSARGREYSVRGREYSVGGREYFAGAESIPSVVERILAVVDNIARVVEIIRARKRLIPDQPHPTQEG